MKFVKVILSLCVFFSITSYAEDDPLIIAIDSNLPPYVMSTGINSYYGFDIDLMKSICISIRRKCVFKSMPFAKLISSVSLKKSNLAISNLTITAARAALVNFSLPYLIDKEQFIGTSKLAKQKFTLSLLNNQNIGVLAGSTGSNIIRSLQIANPKIIEFKQENDLIYALGEGSIKFGLVDSSSAMFWQAESDNKFVALGKPFVYGDGVAIAVNRSDSGLLVLINQALLQYQKTADFTKSYNEYIAVF